MGARRPPILVGERKQHPIDSCLVCRAPLPEGRLPLLCDACEGGLHPSCAGRIDRGETWGDRRMLCPYCVALGEGQK